MSKVSRLVRNLSSFIAELTRYDRFYWRANACRSVNCEIDKTAVVYGNYSLANTKVGYSSYISHNAFIANTTIGKFCSIGPNVVCGWGIHPIHGVSTHPAFYSSVKKSSFTLCDIDAIDEYKPIMIGNDVFIGANVTILDGITIGDGAVIGAGAVVSKDIPPYAVAIGCPIQIVKYRFPDNILNELVKIKWWDEKNSFETVRDNFFNVEGFIENSSTSEKHFS